MDILNKYKVSTDITKDILTKAGFQNGYNRYWIYNRLIRMDVGIDIEDSWWTYQIVNADDGSMYSAYYYRKYGNNEVVKDLDKQVSKIISKLVRQDILVKKKKHRKEECE